MIHYGVHVPIEQYVLRFNVNCQMISVHSVGLIETPYLCVVCSFNIVTVFAVLTLRCARFSGDRYVVCVYWCFILNLRKNFVNGCRLYDIENLLWIREMVWEMCRFDVVKCVFLCVGSFEIFVLRKYTLIFFLLLCRVVLITRVKESFSKTSL